jgi:thioredoxin-related protein
MALSNNKPSGYPTFFFFVPQDAKLFQMPGYQDVNKFVATLNNMEKYQADIFKRRSQENNPNLDQRVTEKNTNN